MTAASEAPQSVEVVIVGTGFSGIGMAIKLREAGITDFVVLEKADGIGGTWRDNHYPGAACDIPSHLYSFSFEQNPAWTRSFSGQPEILGYLERCVSKYGIGPHLRFGAEVAAADYDDASSMWTVRCRDGRVFVTRALVLGNGALHIPALPDLPGQATFTGPKFHTAQWDHSVDLRGKRVAVIGTGASAIQIVPELVPQVAKLSLFQRTPAWVVPKADHAIHPKVRAVYARMPWLQQLVRASIYWRLEVRALGFTRPKLLRLVEPLIRAHIAREVRDPELRAALTPNYRMGCKRVLLSNDYYQALQQPNAEVVTAGIAEIVPTGVRTNDGQVREVDVIVFGTGFRVSDYLSSIAIRGAEGRDLNEVWRGAPGAYLGISVAGFPNLFLLTGPNTGLGHNSMIFMIEAQIHYTMQCIQALRQGLRSLVVRPEVQSEFNVALQTRMARSVWATGCQSWYQTEDGQNSAIWPGFTVDYWRRTRRLRLDEFETHA